MLHGVVVLILVVPLVSGCAGGSADEGAGGDQTSRAAVERDGINTDVGADGDGGTGRAVRIAGAGGLRADLLESRLFAMRRQLELELVNHSSAPVAVDTIRLTTPLFEPAAPDRRDTVVHPGRPALAMPLSYGAARCDIESTDGGDVGVEVVADGRPVHLEVAQPAVALLADLHTDECAQRRVQEAVELRFTGGWHETAPGTVEGELELRARPGGPGASLHELRGSVIFTVAPSATATPAPAGSEPEVPLAVVDGDGGVALLPLVVTAARCDAHALIESKKTFVFTAWVSVGDGEITPLPLEPTGEVLDLFERQLASCSG